jgi:ribosome-associated protein
MPREVATIDSRNPSAASFPDYVNAAVKIMLEKKGEDIVIFDMRGFTPFVDYNLLVSATSVVQAKVLVESVVETVKRNGLTLKGTEGDPESGWVLIDFWDMVVHIFRPELRSYYNLEGLWGDLPVVKVDGPDGEENPEKQDKA